MQANLFCINCFYLQHGQSERSMGDLAFYLVTVAGDLFDCEGDSSVALLICGVVGASVGHGVQAGAWRSADSGRACDRR